MTRHSLVITVKTEKSLQPFCFATNLLEVACRPLTELVKGAQIQKKIKCSQNVQIVIDEMSPKQ